MSSRNSCPPLLAPRSSDDTDHAGPACSSPAKPLMSSASMSSISTPVLASTSFANSWTSSSNCVRSL
eukprot:12647879-Alexandrium_andersonii.AAC.1